MAAGRVPRARYRATCVVHQYSMYLFGGHDGTRHLNDVHTFDFDQRVWSTLQTEGPAPIPRDSHVAVVHGKSMYVFGGSTGSAMNGELLARKKEGWGLSSRGYRLHATRATPNDGLRRVATSCADFHELRLDTCKWSPVQAMGTPPGHRFCHVAVVHNESMYVFGGYDGSNRLNDFLEFHFGLDLMACDVPAGTLIDDLSGFVNNETLSDICFVVEGTPVYAHKILCMRCTYFRAMLMGEMMESRAREIELQDVRHPIFIALLEYLYTDHVEIALDMAMELFQAADQFGVERLKKMCEGEGAHALRSARSLCAL